MLYIHQPQQPSYTLTNPQHLPNTNTNSILMINYRKHLLAIPLPSSSSSQPPNPVKPSHSPHPPKHTPSHLHFPPPPLPTSKQNPHERTPEHITRCRSCTSQMPGLAQIIYPIRPGFARFWLRFVDQTFKGSWCFFCFFWEPLFLGDV
jgi:hypothetical protein